MTLVSDIIRSAYRESNQIPVGTDPNADQAAEGLARLESVLLSTVGTEMGYITEDWNITAVSYTNPSGVPIAAASIATFTIKPNSRLICSLLAPLTLALDPLPQDGQRFGVTDAKANFATFPLTLTAVSRKIEGSTANLVLNTNSTARQWLYRSDLADWVVLAPLDPALEMPFPEDFDDFFIIMLAMRLNPSYGRSLAPESQARLQQQERQFIARYTQSRLRSVPSPAASNPARAEGN